MTFEDIMNYCADNRSVYSNLVKAFEYNNIIPFIGAGMSVPIYPAWQQTLEKLAGRINSNEKKTLILSEIKDSPQAAADQIAKVRSLNVLLDDMREIFKEDRITEYVELENMAAWLLPMLFPKAPVVTTNYDGLLEYIFEQNGNQFYDTITPSRMRKWEQAGQKNLHCLYKIHGSLDDETEEDIVFTATQYQEKYGAADNLDKSLANKLAEWFSGRVMLFMGCSLGDDNTVDVLQKISCNRRITHYAILPCAKGDEMDDRTRELGVWGIRAIFYPEGQHEAVRIILETLLYGMEPEKYRLLKTKKSSLKNQTNEFAFVHNSGKVDFIPREDDVLEELHKFLDDERETLWWAVTGAGGCGKTRLADQLELEIGADWDVFRINDCDPLWLKQEHPRGGLKPQLYILDYIFSNVTAIGRWIAKISVEDYPCKLRFLILDRPMRGEQESLTELLSGNLTPREKREIDNRHYGSDYSVHPLSSRVLKRIMENYICRQTGNRPTDRQLDTLYNCLKQIDPELVRPLFALFISEAAISDSCVLDSDKLLQWSQKEVLDFIVERELQLLDSTVQSMDPSRTRPKLICQAVEKALAFATVTGGIAIDEYCDELFPEDGILIKQFCNLNYDRKGFFKELKISDELEIFPLKPDIIGEYLILYFLSKQDEEFVKEFVGKAWQHPRRMAETMRRIFSDFDASDENGLMPLRIKRQFENVQIMDGVQRISANAFKNCTFLKSIRCPESVKQIGAMAFQNCVSLTTVYLPDGVTCLEEKLFANCVSLTSIHLPACLEIISKETFWNCRSLALLENGLPDSITQIKGSAFHECVCLKNINIPSRVEYLANSIFDGCSSLEEVCWGEGIHLTAIGTYAFHGCSSLKTISIPASVNKIEWAAFEDCMSITTIELPEGIKILRGYVFKGCENLEEVRFPGSLMEIGFRAFENCTRLRKISFSNRVNIIDSYAFYCCSALEKAEFSFGVNAIGRFSFADCPLLSFPDGKINVLNKIGQYAFRNCRSLEKVCLLDELEEVGEGCFEGCLFLSEVSLPGSLTNIHRYTFNKCRALKNIQIPESVQRIYHFAFAQSGIEKVVLPASVEEVKPGAFGKCSKLKEVIVEGSDTVISPKAFISCSIRKIQGKKWQVKRIKKRAKERYHEIPLIRRSNVGTNVLPPKRKPGKRVDLELPDLG